MFKLIRTLAIAFTLSISFTSIAYADFYVIPVLKNMKNVVTVAKSGGQFTDVSAALASIGDKANADNPYLLFIGPGVYTVTETVQMKEWVSITGSGEGTTTIKGAISTDNYASSSSTIIMGADNSTLSHLSVINEGGGNYSIGIFNDDTSPTIRNVTVESSAFGESYAVHNSGNLSKPTLVDVKASSIAAGLFSVGVFNEASSPSLTNVEATGQGGGINYGVYNNSSSPTIRNSTLNGITAGLRGGTASSSTIIGGLGGSATCSHCVVDGDATSETQWAYVDSDGTILDQSGGITITSDTTYVETYSYYYLDFGNDISESSVSAVMAFGSGAFGFIHTRKCTTQGFCMASNNVNTLFVGTAGADGNESNRPFYVTVIP